MAGFMKPVNTFKDELTCFMCLQVFTYPVSLNCSHSFCLKCIQDHLKHKAAADKYSCPECHAEFEVKPRLVKNGELSDKVQQHARCHENGIICDYCLEEESPAVMSCLQCEAFFCMTHLRPHSEKVYLKDHVLVEPAEAMSLRKCPEHKEILKLFCRDHGTCICMLCCIVGQHKQHPVCTIEEAKKEAEDSLVEKLQDLNTKKIKIKDAIKQLREIHSHSQDAYSAFHEKAVHHYKQIKALIEEDELQALQFIESERQVAISHIESQTKEQVEELDDMERTIQQIHALLNQTDTVRFLKGVNCNEYRIHSILRKQQLIVHETVVDEEKLSSLIKSITKLSNSLTKQTASVRKAFLAYATTVTLDPGTANENLILSENRTAVHYTDEPVKSPYNPKRFDDTLYVLGCEGFNFGRHYWEVVVKSKTDWEIGVAYSSLPRKGKTWLGRNNISWSLDCSGGQCTGWHNNRSTKLNMKPNLERVGVYLDYTGGMLSFYDAEKMTLLLSFYSKFTEAVHPVLNPCNSKGGNFAPLIVL
ncbi:zinc-binding protein A33-like [Acipenser ruthenus]|uniref:zinc-binding protein A33-like n=1 Tax=Acipenser ruthenus TaxID=7906 RepID=UPI0027428365|nr:zinc-binding protein A33-like [Acipenser ruthenus]